MIIENASFSVAPNGEPTLPTSVPSIEREHAELVFRLDSLSNNAQALFDSAAFSEILSQLGNQINTHINNEERIFKFFDIPEEVISSHVRAHSEILDQYHRLNMDLMKRKARSRSVALRMIKDWIIGHVAYRDLIIRNYLRKLFVTTD